MLDPFLEELALVPAAEVDAARLGLRLSPADMAEFRAGLRKLLDDFAERPDDRLRRPGRCSSPFIPTRTDPTPTPTGTSS